VISAPSDNGDALRQSTERLLLGIDHTAITVSDSEALLRFQGEGLGLEVHGGTENLGRERERLSRLPGAGVRITRFEPGPGPGWSSFSVRRRRIVGPNRPTPLWHDEARFHATDVKLRWVVSGLRGSTGLRTLTKECSCVTRRPCPPHPTSSVSGSHGGETMSI